MDVRGVPSAALMERAGVHAATLVDGMTADGPRRVLVVAGGGDNGGDARIVARCLRSWGQEVRLIETSADARSGLLTRDRVLAEPAGDLTDAQLDAAVRSADVVVDGMLGTGASGALRGQIARVARLLQEARSGDGRRPLVVALDVPTGVDADTGAVVEHAVRATATIAFGWPKLGTLLFPARALAGRIVSVEIGFPPLAPEGEAGSPPTFTWSALDGDWARGALPRRDPDTHKNAAGPVLVVAGSEGMAGAAILAGRAALRSGAGYLRVASVSSNRNAVQAALPEAVWVDRADTQALDDALAASRAVVVGPGVGLGADAREVVDRVLGGGADAGVPSVVDADALTLLADGDPRGGDVLTPHPGEAARLLGTDPAAVQADRLGSLERLRERTGAVVLLKGRPSLVAGRHRRLDPTGSSDLATAGVGDVLAGTIGAQIARGADPEDAACLGLWLTSAAARIAGKGAGLQSADLPEYLPAALAEARAGGRPSGPGSAHDPARDPWVTLDLPIPASGEPGA